MKSEIAAHFKIPLCESAFPSPNITPATARGALNPTAARSAALALQKAASSSSPCRLSSSDEPAHKIPGHRIRQLEDTIKTFLGRDPSAEPPGLKPGDLGAVLAGNHIRKMSVKGCMRPSAASLVTEPSGSGQRGEEDDRERSSDEAQGEASMSRENTTAMTASLVSSDAIPVRDGGHWQHGQRVVQAALAMGGDESLQDIARR